MSGTPHPYSPQFSRDDEHLRMLSIAHYVVGALVGLCGSIPIVHVGLGIAMISGAFENAGPGEAPPPELGWFFVVIGGLVVGLSWAVAICAIIAGLSLARRKRYIFCIVIAAVLCLWMPLGTILGVLTLVVLLRDSVKQQFAAVAAR